MDNIQIDFTTEMSLLQEPIVLLGLFFIFLIIAGYIALLIVRSIVRKKTRMKTAFNLKVLQVTVPKIYKDDKGGSGLSWDQTKEKIAVMQTFFSAVAGLPAEKGWKAWFYGLQNAFSFEIVALKGKIYFYIAVPEKLQSYVEEQVQAQFTTALVEELPDYNIFSPKCVIDGKILKFGKEQFFPIKTFRKFEADPLNSLLNALNNVDEADGAAIQIVAHSAPGDWRKLGIKVASKMQQGKKFSEALAASKGGFWNGLNKAFKDLAKPAKKEGESTPEAYKLSPLEEEQVKGMEEKAAQAGAFVNIRIVAASEKKEKVDLYLNNLINAFAQYNVYNYGNGFKPEKIKVNNLANDFIYRFYDEHKKLTLNTEELASLFHLPIPQVNEVPGIKWLESKKAPAPQNMPKDGIILGYNFYRGKKTEVRIQREARTRHMYIIGQTGTGKSYFQTSMIAQDIKNGEGCCFIDPHGKDLEEILALVPKERAEDVIFIDPSDMERPISLNMLEYDDKNQLTFMVNEVMAIFDKLYDLKATGGPMFEQYFKNACYLVMDDPATGSTLMEVPKVLADDDFREMKLSHCTNPVVVDFWRKEAMKAGGEASLANMVPYITSKLAPFIANDVMRPIISQQKSSVNFAEAMDSGKIVLVKLSKGKLGKINSDLIGMIVIMKILMAALGRDTNSGKKLKDFYLYIDEFQNFLTDSIETILSEARKYRLCLTVGHQYLGQLVKNNDTKFKDAIFGNVGTKVAFRVGVDDAETFAKEFAPIFTEEDFLNVPFANCFVKELIDNANPPPFNMFVPSMNELPISPKNDQLAAAIKQLSRLKYGKDRELIEMEVAERMQGLDLKVDPVLSAPREADDSEDLESVG